MNLNAAPFSLILLILCWVIAVAQLLYAGWRVPWATLKQEELTSWFGATIVILAGWQLKASIQPGLAYHLLGATALTLIAGRGRALLSMAAILAFDTAYDHAEWPAFGLSWLICTLPVWITDALLRFARKRLPANYFVYIFVNAFAAGALGMWLVGIITCALLAASGTYSFDFLLEEQLPYYFLMGWPEAFTTGINLTLLVIYRPQWVATFDDNFYLRN
ncbi:energy-coupling factor ABC transporter permease [Andreprevotia chitinilytica]|uniref:energy-coupling factor ABC transporter permease n=1 Tax=Andreprevotia chitinilytica TaxID=396808 RepID=UPI0005545B19|nr:energy-coupling factor ABC transporter permease [Andreprevotia chitinilytica]